MIGASIGIAVLGGRTHRGHTWLREADRAMYDAKRTGGNHITIGAQRRASSFAALASPD